MFSLLFRCAACDKPLPNPVNFPLCKFCTECLVDCPPLCPNCGGLYCLEKKPERKCQRPWAHRPEIHSYSGRYLLVDQTYKILKKWKIRRGPLFDHQILKPSDHLSRVWAAFDAQAVTPVPQNFDRAWKMRGSRSLIIANWVSSLTRLPVICALDASRLKSKQKRQAELTGHERYANPTSFSISNERSLKNINRLILVDDFMTTGYTLSKAANLLVQFRPLKIHIFCLGIRPGKLSVE